MLSRGILLLVEIRQGRTDERDIVIVGKIPKSIMRGKQHPAVLRNRLQRLPSPIIQLSETILILSDIGLENRLLIGQCRTNVVHLYRGVGGTCPHVRVVLELGGVAMFRRERPRGDLHFFVPFIKGVRSVLCLGVVGTGNAGRNHHGSVETRGRHGVIKEVL